jgi:ATP-dependent exoDNAse (exonuclease V) beta subunit
MSKIKIYKASAGSGKTYTLALEYIRELLIASSEKNYQHILAVTFTKDATGEMKDRILAELYGLAFNTQDSAGFLASLQKKLKEIGKSLSETFIREKSKTILRHILHDYSRLNITTIDSFFQRVLRNLARELGKGSKFNLEMNTNKVLHEAVHSTIEKANHNKQILEWLTTYIENKLDDDRNWRIDDEIFEFSKCIYNEFFQEHEQALRKQIKENPRIFRELKAQQEKIKRDCKTYFVYTYQQVQQLLASNHLISEDFIRKGIPIHFFRKLAEGDYTIERNKTILDCCGDSSFWTTKTSKKRNEIIALADSSLIPILNETLSVYNRMLTARMITGNLHQLGLIWDITKEITEQNAENNRFMLSDTAMFLNEMIDGSDAPFIYEKLGAEIHHVMIDEFQDTSRLQWRNFKVLLSNIIADDNFSLIVGDVKQSIYRWRNGDWRILSNIDKELDAKIESLGTNYRSEKVIVDFNNLFFTQAASMLNGLYCNRFNDADNSPFPATYNEKELYQKSKKAIESGYVSIDFVPDKVEDMAYSDLMQEAVFLQLKKLYANGIPANQICILTRKNKDLTVLAEYLATLKKDYPEMAEKHYLNIVSNEAFQLNSSPAIKIIIEALRTIHSPENSINKEQLIYFLQSVSQSDKTVLETVRSNIQELSRMPLFELIGYIYRLFKLEQIEDQSAYLFAFYDAVANYLNEKPADINRFLRYWDEELKTKAIPTGSGISGVCAMTIHKSKGLQFHTVIIPYCDWSINPKANTTVWCGPKANFYELELLPIAYTNAMSETVFAPEFQEETAQTWMDNLNILYVGFTRAEHNLILLAKHKKSLNGIEKLSTVSDLLQLSVNDLDGNWNEENLHFEKGELDVSQAEKDKISDNPLKQIPSSFPVSFVSKEFQPEKSIFKQSNKSREFINPDAPNKEQYVSYGNIMHRLFEQINQWEDIEKAIDNHISEGIIHSGERQDYIEKITAAIQESQVENWFSEEYKSYQEYSIITEENGEVATKRPDRVLFSENATLVIDYKFGEEHHFHKKQVKEYVDLLKKMNYPQVEGYLWYVEKRKVEKVQ